MSPQTLDLWNWTTENQRAKMSPQTPDLWNWNEERENTKPTPPPPLHHPPSPHPSQGQCEKKKKTFTHYQMHKINGRSEEGEGFERDSTYGQTMTTSQWQRQRHQLDNDDGKKEARFIGLGIWERERERRTWIWD